MVNKNSNDVMLTTIDNPYSPFDNYSEWLMFDIEKKYNTCEKLARLVVLSDEMTQKEEEEAYDDAMDKLIECDFMGIYMKITREEAKSKTN